MEKSHITAPEIDHYLKKLERLSEGKRESKTEVIFDEKSYAALRELASIVEKHPLPVPVLWVKASRGDANTYAQVVEQYNLTVPLNDSYQSRLERLYPEEVVWYGLHFNCNLQDDFRITIMDKTKSVDCEIPACSQSQCDTSTNQIYPLAQWICDCVNHTIAQLESGTYFQTVEKELPYIYRNGTIVINQYWRLYPEERRRMFCGVSEEVVAAFLNHMRQSSAKKPKQRIRNMTLETYFQYAGLFFQIKRFPGWETLSPKELYLQHTDNAKAVLLRHLPIDSEEIMRMAVGCALCDNLLSARRNRILEHSIYPTVGVVIEDDGYYISISQSRKNHVPRWEGVMDAVTLYMALVRLGVPVVCEESAAICKSLEGLDTVKIRSLHHAADYENYDYKPLHGYAKQLDYDIHIPSENPQPFIDAVNWKPLWSYERF